jgi:hypothetical protein
MNLRALVCSAVLLASAIPAVAGEPDSVVVLAQDATPAHPRNSEGSFATLRSGRIIYYYSQFSEGDSDFSPCEIAELASDDGGRTWSRPRVMFKVEPNTMEMSVSLLRLASGKLACFSAIKRDKLDCRPYLRLSEDDGVTWSAPRRIVDAPGYFVLNNDRVIQTKTGRLIMPLGWHRLSLQSPNAYEGIDLRAVALWYYSDDEGLTWKESDTWWALPAVTQTGLQEPGVVELADGTLLSWARTDQGCQYEFRSTDNGVTWSAPQPMPLRSPAAPASIMRLPGSADLLGVYVDHSGQFPFALSERTYSNRNPLVASVSSDNGVTWRTRLLLENDPQRDYCYTAIHFTADAALFAYLSVSREPARQPHQMIIRRVSLARLTTPEDALSARAKSVLRDVMQAEESWIKIHAAEALLAGGETAAVRAQLLAMRPTLDSRVYRVGVWRVLANTSATLPERLACVAEVEKIFLNPAAPDRSQALETLCKLRHRVTGPTLAAVRQLAADPAAPLRGLARWALRLADEPGALASLTALLQSPDDGQRLIAAYALRMLRETDPAALAALAEAARREVPSSRAHPYVVSAAFALGADPARRGEVQKILASEAATDAARFEACQGLLAQVTRDDRPAFAPLLASTGPDTRVGAALAILHAAVRP